jgi:hypothetical protein
VLNAIRWKYLLGLGAKIDAVTPWQSVPTTQGAHPYNIDIAIRYASPISEIVLTEGRRRKAGTVNTARAARKIQLES